MSDLISRQDVIDLICEQTCGYEKNDCFDSKMPCGVVKAIKDFPSAQKTGHWFDIDYKDYKAKCSSCGIWSPIMGKYCPNCGAKMEVQDEAD